MGKLSALIGWQTGCAAALGPLNETGHGRGRTLNPILDVGHGGPKQADCPSVRPADQLRRCMARTRVEAAIAIPNARLVWAAIGARLHVGCIDPVPSEFMTEGSRIA